MSRFALATATDHSAYLWIVTLVSLTWSTFTWAFRLFARVGFYGIDDYFVTAAQIVALGQCGAIIVALRHGLGITSEELDVSRHHAIGRAVMASQLLCLIVLALSKLSVLLLLRRIFSSAGDYVLLSNGLLGITVIWAISVLGAIGTECLPGSPEVCSQDVLRWSMIVAFDICIELVLVLSPIFYMWNCTTGYLAFPPLPIISSLLGLLTVATNSLIALSVAYLKAYITALHSHNSGLHFTIPIIWQQIILLYSLLSATYPFMQNYMRTFTTAGLGFSTTDYGASSSKSYAHSRHSQLRSQDRDRDQANR
ncbi:hypothetical protein MBLNU459_g7248t2 [Dothideomycetes sp. NU459]